MRTHTRSQFPTTAAARIAGQYGPRWAAIAERATSAPLGDPHRMALTLMLRRLHRAAASLGDADLHREAFRCEPPCPTCAAELLTGCGLSDAQLVTRYQRALAEVRRAVRSLRAQRTRQDRQRARIA